jgi:hypothetical protein
MSVKNTNLRSGPDYKVIHVSFKNNTQERINIFWVDNKGYEIKYKTLDPNNTHKE